MNETKIIDSLGNKVSGITGWMIDSLESSGLDISSFSSKILTLIVLSLILFLAIKFSHKIGNKILKIIIIILIIVFIISVLFSLILEIGGLFV